MTTLVRRPAAALEITDWFNRLVDDALRPSRLGSLVVDDEFRIEQFHSDAGLVIRAELPGIDPDRDVHISVHDGMLHIKAERRVNTEHKDSSGYRSEFRYGSFERALAMPAGIDAKAVTATYRDGLLEVVVPVSEGDMSATVPVVRLP